MSKEAVFTMKLEPELRAEFMAEAASEDRPASQIMRELMRGYIAQRRQARENHNHSRHRIEDCRPSTYSDLGQSNGRK
ncbi:antitoxin of toxin-antitoxin stability system [Serratia marcescens]|jgi:hypothetical protein|uniref:antitoxin of toxin-antitoxin stability system n=1 Tax=Serratia marcescens TaxID=615 RepID=UPI00274CC0F9|nr:antitoxin of toxin-antitoxin stability system [Serratia marcescens]MDP8705784.1 antitoxin of toxin-antitoxin stability system [Serratia marcescens]